MFTRFLAVALMAASLGGCATLEQFGSRVFQNVSNVISVIDGVNVTPQAVVIAANSADALQDTAAAYLRLPRCTATSGPVCRQPAATQPIKRAVLAMRSARNDLETWLSAHPGSAPPASLYDKATAAISALGDIINQFNAGPAVAAVAK